MKIISNFTDYYDSIQQYGQDTELKYIRYKKYPEENFNLAIKTFSSFEDTKTITHNLYGSFILGFCGNLYVGEVIQKIKDSDALYPFNNGEISYMCNYCSSEEELVEKLTRSDRINLWDRPNTIIFNNIFNNKNILSLFHKYSTPCFIISGNKIRHGDTYRYTPTYKYNLTINPQLKKYQFYKIKDPFTTFQDISMFISGVLPNPGNTMVEISDREMAIKKGFGHKYAFRKEPTKHK